MACIQEDAGVNAVRAILMVDFTLMIIIIAFNAVPIKDAPAAIRALLQGVRDVGPVITEVVPIITVQVGIVKNVRHLVHHVQVHPCVQTVQTVIS